ncbi:MAG TPA: CHASE2 domain-containing protein [Burkholderiales bacterium]|nr:CHASE2 domain-containing protein [Burkholderiales bacterium]
MGAGLLLALAALFVLEPPQVGTLRNTLFDSYQRLLPRERKSMPAEVVAVDEAALAEYGQWPWPRALTARLLRRIESFQPAAIGVDVLFAEPDRYSPGGSSDAALAQAVAGHKVVLGIAGLPRPRRDASARPAAPPFIWKTPPPQELQDFLGHVQSLPLIDSAAAGRGLLNADEEDRVVRRVPLVARVSDTYVATLGVEMLRVAAGIPALSVAPRDDGLLALRLGDLSIPMQRDGSAWLYFGPHEETRRVSAAEVLGGRVDPELLRGKLVLVGVTGVGLLDTLDTKATPLGATVPGVELHQQLLEQIYDGNFLIRPPRARAIELALLVVAGALMVVFVPTLRAWASAALFLTVLASLAVVGLVSFHLGSLIDVASPALSTTLLYGAVLAVTLAEADRQRRALRDAAERMEGELLAARRIQMGLLPTPGELFAIEDRFSLAASLEPARIVGGDFYDCFMLDADRLFFVIADVSGKGLPASLFMALSKTLLKSAALRMPGDIGDIFSRASAEISRENPESLFVSVFAGIFDARSGGLEYCNAGHQPPYAKRRDGSLQRFELADGPPLCVIAGYPYRSRHRLLAPDEWVCVVTDGVTEAMDPRGALFGAQRLEAALAGVPAGTPTAQIVTQVRESVARFVGEAVPSDDITLLCLKRAARALNER